MTDPSKSTTCEGSGLPPAYVTLTGPPYPGGVRVPLRGSCQRCHRDYSLIGRGTRRVIRKHAVAAKDGTDASS